MRGLPPARFRTAAGLFRRCPGMVIASAFVLLWNLAPVQAVDVESTRWGLTGNVQNRQFNLLSVVLRNNSPEAYDGGIRLRKYVGPGAVDATYVEPVFLSPYSERIVQLPVFVGEWGENWQLSILNQPGAVNVPSPRAANPGVVQLMKNVSLGQSLNGIPKIDDQYFPVSTAGLSDVKVILLDHQPDWEEARARTLLDWIALGGQLHLIPGLNGQLPTFTGPLAKLNSPLDSWKIQAGQVVRHAQSFAKLKMDDIYGAVGMPVVKPDDQQVGYRNLIDYESGEYWGRGFFPTLKKLTNPEHFWLLIHLLAWMYVALVFPGAWLLGLKWNNYRITFAVTLGSVLVFGLMFQMLGRRGYGEKTQLNTVAVLRPVSDDAWAVEGWSSTFVTSSGQRGIKHDGSGLAYSTCQTQEAVQGVIRSGTDGAFVANFPPYSHREFTYRQRINQPVPKAEWQSVELITGEGPASVKSGEIKISGPFPTTPTQAFLVSGKQVRALVRRTKSEGSPAADPLSPETGEIWVARESRGDLSTFVRSGQASAFNYSGRMQGSATRDDVLNELTPLLIARAAGIAENDNTSEIRVAGNIAYAVFFAELPKELLAKSDSEIEQHGWAVYVLPLPLFVEGQVEDTRPDDQPPED